MTDLELRGISSILSRLVSEAVTNAKAEMRSEFEIFLADRIQNLPEGRAGKDAEPVDENAIVQRVLSQIPPPKDGLDAPAVDVDSIVLRAAELVPRPENGKDADPEFIRSEIAKAVAALPPAKDGQDAPPVDISAIIAEVVHQVPAPKDGLPGKDADEAALLDKLVEQLRAELDKWPRPKDGERGQDAPAVDTAALVADVLRQIPTPQNGRDADPEIVRQLVSDEVQRAVSSLPAPKDGQRGLDGKDGESIHPDTVALMIREAVDKLPKPEPGKPGEPGKSALEIEVRTGIDPEKSYPVGTVATYQGGTIRAFRNTDAVTNSLQNAGWQVLLDGVADEQFIQGEDFRSLTFTRTYTSGRVVTVEMKTPFMQHIGYWDKSKEYFRSECVTQNGSTWYCMVDSTTEKPGEGSTHWLLIARKGSDGKDYREPAPKNGSVHFK